ncbi:helix-turn-helix domain-containing protein [Halobacillus sp. A5]|uniref:helix-turn-helix domain-containing protein n=1 Tax=Halobacillus sp. A5 TaxID=2880263 RepID=UPI0020A6C8A0|nr:helix-turn-helix domain-containing protein [Halobacillus sp. A5]MCP3026539.1 helix-turn-helix domain-containing protein [Halobacillus sp. A5]
MEIEQIRSLQTFSSVKEMDEHVRSFLFKMKAALSEGTLKVLKFIWRHSVKYRGVSFAKIETIEKHTNISRRTVIRSINRLEKEKLLERVETTKANGKRGANILVILHQEDLFLPDDVTPAVTPHDTVAPSSKPSSEQPSKAENNSEAVNKQSESSSSKSVLLDYTYLPSFIPKPFVITTQPFLNPSEILTAWRTVESAYKQWNMRDPLEWYIEPVTEVFKQAVFAQKHGMIQTTFMGYYFGGLKNRFMQMVRRETLENPKTIHYDWLNE